MNEVLWSRCVTGIPAYAGAAIADVIPGTISNGTPASRQRARLLAAAREHEHVAALEPHDLLAVAPELHDQRGDLVLRERVLPGFLADVDLLAVRRRELDDRRRREIVVHQRVALRQRARPLERQKPRITGARADQPDSCPAVESLRRSSGARRAVERRVAVERAQLEQLVEHLRVRQRLGAVLDRLVADAHDRAVQQLRDDRHRHAGDQRCARARSARAAREEPFELGLADRLGLLRERRDHRDRDARLVPLLEALDVLGDDLLRPAGSPRAASRA